MVTVYKNLSEFSGIIYLYWLYLFKLLNSYLVYLFNQMAYDKEEMCSLHSESEKKDREVKICI